MNILNNTTKLQNLMDKINALPEAGAGIEAHNTDTTAHADIRAEILNSAGKNVTGTRYTINEETVIAGENAEVFNDYVNNKASGKNSHAEGKNTTSSGQSSHAEGEEAIASGNFSHAENAGTIASGLASHAEGMASRAASQCAHAEGHNTFASAIISHAEGNCTIAASKSQHAQGEYNIEDANGVYAHIVGNGKSTARSNAHTLDWSGNAWFAGDVYIGSASGTNKDNGSKKLVTVDEMNDAIVAIPTPDVSGQITTHNTSDSAHNDIRELVSELTVRLNTLADSDDTTLDQISEIVNYIKSNKSLIESITTNKVNVTDIVDNLTTNVANKPLSASQGVALKSLIDTSIEEVETNIKPYIFNIDYNTLLAFDTSEIVFDNSCNTSTSSVLGKAVLGKMILA